jgi:hypothetical protein
MYVAFILRDPQKYNLPFFPDELNERRFATFVSLSVSDLASENKQRTFCCPCSISSVASITNHV